jgi:plasmid maintenance system killer protein
MIVSFGDAATEDFFHGVSSSKDRKIPANVSKSIKRKLDLSNAATDLNGLRVPAEQPPRGSGGATRSSLSLGSAI